MEAKTVRKFYKIAGQTEEKIVTKLNHKKVKIIQAASQTIYENQIKNI